MNTRPPNISTKRSPRRGFTLIEALATMALMAIILPVVARGLSLAQQAASVAKHTSEASGLAQAKLNELTTSALAGGNQSGEFGGNHPGFRWASVSAQREYGLLQVDLSVTWMERVSDRTITISTLYLPPGTTTGSSSTGSGTSSRAGGIAP